ncbi:phage tail tape measure protein [Rugamonas aquatica]|uniref:Phage tail tape measure protein n=1 Tax=Rugamonas aquatica TaxID=2743357 RepID=A0A6A7N226_9BURK|nr:hypothetical protein [Rugamonas aquatica]MQA39055.1 hypothetical protein [Rugamonas aquatica]
MAGPYISMINLRLTTETGQALIDLAKRLKDVDDAANKTKTGMAGLEEAFKKIKEKGAFGKSVAGVGMGMFEQLRKPYEEAAKAAQAQASFETLNLGAQANADVYAKAAAVSHQVLGSGIADNITRVRELHGVLGDLPQSLALSGDFAQYAFAATAANGGKEVEGQTVNAAKALSLRGGNLSGSAPALREELDLQSRVSFASGGKVGGAEFVAAGKAGKQAYQHYDKEYLYGQFSAYMAQTSGETAGANGQAAYATLVGGGMDGKAKGFLSQLGLLQTQGKGHPGPAGLSAANAGLMAQRPDKFIGEVLVPAMRKKYGKIGNEQMASLLEKKFDQPTARFLGDQIVNQPRLQNQAQAYQKASGYGGAYQSALQSPKGAEMAAAQSWKNLLTVIGTAYLPRVVDGLTSLAHGLDKLSALLEEYPALTTGLVYGFGLLAGALAIGGTISMVTASLGGLAMAATAIVALSTPILLVVAAVALLGAGLYFLLRKSPPKPEAPDAHTPTTRAPFAASGPYLAGSAPPPVGTPTPVKLAPGVPYQTFSPVPPPMPAPVFKVENKLDYRNITTRIFQEAGTRMARPPTGPNTHDGSMHAPSVAYAG